MSWAAARVPSLESEHLLAIHRQLTTAIQDGAEARLAEIGVAHSPPTGAADDLREHGARGIGLIGALEATPMAKAREVFETNTFGVMAMTQAVLPQFRVRRSGVVVNVTSSVTLAPMPLVSVYTASKTAIEGFTGSLAHELHAFNVRVKLVEPGYGPTTRFTQNSDTGIEDAIPAAYMPFAAPILAAFPQPAAVTTEADVADAVWRAANDMSGQLRYPAGPDAVALAQHRQPGHLQA